MSTGAAEFRSRGWAEGLPRLSDLTFAPARLAAARALVVFSFVWPFFNYNLVDPGNATEINFLPVFLAALVMPEALLRDRWSLLLALPAFAVAVVWASPAAPLRMAIGIVPLHVLLNMTRCLCPRRQDLVPPNVAYRCLQVFVAFCAVQSVHFKLFRVIPEWLTSMLVALIPRYSEVPYDFAGVRGVQGWATEPSTAALTCMGFACVALYQRPDRHWRVLSLMTVLLMLNKSIYCMIATALLALGCLSTLKRRLYAVPAMMAAMGGLILYMTGSGRWAELRDSLLSNGFDRESNHDLMRFVQILNPLAQFPHVYQPITLYGVWVAEPIGLLPLVAGYGSVLGVCWLGYFLWRNVLRGQSRQLVLLCSAVFVLLIMAPPDLIPSAVAVAIFAGRRRRSPPPGSSDLSAGGAAHA